MSPGLDNPVLSNLNIQPTERFIGVKEINLADSNFILTNLMKEILRDDQNKLCLVSVHNTIGHYQNIGKKLGFDLIKKIADKHCIVVTPLKCIVEAIDKSQDTFEEAYSNGEYVVKNLFLDIRHKVSFLKIGPNNRVHLIIDDVSHLSDLGVDRTNIVKFINNCANLLRNEIVSIVINCHVCNVNDEIISNSISYIADVNIEVAPLKTGISHDVAGVITVKRVRQNNEFLLSENVFHYKAYDKDIKVFAPGESLYHLYK